MAASVTLLNRDWLDWPETRKLAVAFDAAGEALRFVGGAVRDGLLGRAVHEVDAATPATPERVTTLLKAAGLRAIPTGIDHGTVTALVDGRAFEITTLRRDVACDGRHAEVAYTDDWEQDAQRRDFTMNALYCAPEGEIFDYTGGAEDARAGRVRFIGDAQARIREDALRMLRFFRFYAGYGSHAPDAPALSACRELAGLIEGLSGERIQAEMLKLLALPQMPATLELMQENRVLAHVLPFSVLPFPALARLPEIFAALEVLQDGELVLAQLLRSLPQAEGAEKLQAINLRWKLSGKTAKRLNTLLNEPALSETLDEPALKRHLRRLGAPLFCDLVLLSAAEAGTQDIAPYRTMLALAQRWQPPAFPVSGDDLKALGIAPGPELGKILKELEIYWEAQHYAPDKAALLARAAR